MFTIEKARDKMGRAYPKLAVKESKSRVLQKLTKEEKLK
jgi:hypothetical protein